MSEPDPHPSGASRRYPPDVPNVARRVRLYPRQVAGLVVLATIPVLAMLGLLSAQQQHASRVTATLRVEVEYPGRLRASQHGVLRVTATNRSSSRLDHVLVSLPDGYLAGFADRAGAGAAPPDHEAVMAPLGPGESRTVEMDLLAERFGRHEGRIGIVSSAGDTLSIPLRTLILP